jgi:5-methyltetrahydrofolate--homocysteine methyltransferase
MGPHGETIYPEGPQELAAELAAFVRDFGVNAIGGCCGSTPEHISALREAVAPVERANATARRSVRKRSRRR